MIASRILAFLFAALIPLAASGDPLPLPWVQDFEQNSGGFTSSTATSWKWGAPAAGPGAAHSGTHVWGTNLNSAVYSEGENAALSSSALDFSGAGGKWLVVHWWQWLESEEDFDQAYVEVSKDGGDTWETIFGPRSGDVNSTWTQHTVFLDPSYASATFMIRFRLDSDNVTPEDQEGGGFFVDDLRISAATMAPAVPLQDFEDSDGGFEAGGTGSSWAYGEPASPTGGAHSGTKAWATNLDGFYNPSEQSYLKSPAYDLSAFASTGGPIVVTWWQSFVTESVFDVMTVEVSKDNGVTWAAASTDERLMGPIAPEGWMRCHAIVDSTYATPAFRLRFRLSADSNSQFDGVGIDDVEILTSSELDPHVDPFEKVTIQNVAASFERDDFGGKYTDKDGGALESIKVTTLPTNGTLFLDQNPVALDQVIPATDLDTLSYEPQTNFIGTDKFSWASRNFFGASNTEDVTIHVNEPGPEVLIISAPKSQTVNPGQTVTFSVQASSSLTLHFQWYKNGVLINQAPDDHQYTIASSAEGDQGNYYVVVSNSDYPNPDHPEYQKTSVQAALVVNDGVTIDQQPVGGQVNEGNSLTLSVTASGSGELGYQWIKDGDPIVGANFASYTIDDATEDDAGAYQCQVTNSVGSKTSDKATVTVGTFPRIVAQPISRGVILNGKVRFTVNATGMGPLTYQWFRNGVEIPGATTSTLALNQLQFSNQGGYSVRVSNDLSHVDSVAADLAVFEWSDVVGVYQDELEATAPTGAGNTPFPGRLTTKISKGGRSTGVLQYRGAVYRFKGIFKTDMILEAGIRRRGLSPLNVHLELRPGTREIVVKVTHEELSGTFESEGVLPLHRYKAKGNPAPQEGAYTMLFEPKVGSQGPASPAWVTAKVSASGMLKVSGKLPDGSAILDSAYVHTDNSAAIFRKLYANKYSGELCGRITLPATVRDMEVTGDLAWRRPEQLKVTLTTGAFVADLAAVGSRYVAPTASQPYLALPGNNDMLSLQISGGMTGAPLQRWIQLLNGRQFLPVPKSDENIRYSFAPANGRFTGTIIDQTTQKAVKMQGVTLQFQKEFGGILVNPTQPGAFYLIPN